MWAFVSSAIVSFLFSPVAIFLARRCNLVDDPKKRDHPAHTHRGVIPRAGGLSIGVAIILVSLTFLTLNKILVGVLLGCIGYLVMGILDDYFDLSPEIRLLVNIIIAQSVVFFGGFIHPG